MKKKTTKKSMTKHRSDWTAADVRQLKSLAKAKTPTAEIAAALGRTPGAVYQRASSQGITLGGGRKRTAPRRRK